MIGRRGTWRDCDRCYAEGGGRRAQLASGYGGVTGRIVAPAVMSALANNAEKRDPSGVLGGTSAVPQAQLRADHEFAP